MTSIVPVGFSARQAVKGEVKVKSLRRALHKLAACLAAAGLVLTAGCAGAGSLGGIGERVTIAMVSNSQMTDAQKLSSEFEKENPGIKLKFISLSENQARAKITDVDRDGRQSIRRRDDQQLRDPAMGRKTVGC